MGRFCDPQRKLMQNLSNIFVVDKQNGDVFDGSNSKNTCSLPLRLKFLMLFAENLISTSLSPEGTYSANPKNKQISYDSFLHVLSNRTRRCFSSGLEVCLVSRRKCE